MSIILWIIIGLLAGWLANVILGSDRGDSCTNSLSDWSAPSSAA